jgi:hypothetical protein
MPQARKEDVEETNKVFVRYAFVDIIVLVNFTLIGV